MQQLWCLLLLGDGDDLDLHSFPARRSADLDAHYKNEIAPAALAAADAYIADRVAQARLLGELHHAIEAGTVDAHAAFPELGEVIAGLKPGRASDEACVICDLTGTGVQDTAIAALAVARARTAGAGTVFRA